MPTTRRTPPIPHLGYTLPVLLVMLTATPAFSAPPVSLSCPSSLEGHPALTAGAVEVYAGEPAPNESIAPTSEGNPSIRGRPNLWEWPKIGMPAGKTVVLCRYEGISKVIRLKLTPDIKLCKQDLQAHTFSCS